MDHFNTKLQTLALTSAHPYSILLPLIPIKWTFISYALFIPW